MFWNVATTKYNPGWLAALYIFCTYTSISLAWCDYIYKVTYRWFMYSFMLLVRNIRHTIIRCEKRNITFHTSIDLVFKVPVMGLFCCFSFKERRMNKIFSAFPFELFANWQLRHLNSLLLPENGSNLYLEFGTKV